jgi:hypothetical protein
MHQLTNLPDDAAKIPEFGARNDRMRREGTQNLLAGAAAAGSERILAQSIAWEQPGIAASPPASTRTPCSTSAVS